MLDYGGLSPPIWILRLAQFWTGRGLVLVLCALCYKVSIWLAKIGKSSKLKSWISQSETTKKQIDLKISAYKRENLVSLPNCSSSTVIQIFHILEAKSEQKNPEFSSLPVKIWVKKKAKLSGSKS